MRKFEVVTIPSALAVGSVVIHADAHRWVYTHVDENRWSCSMEPHNQVPPRGEYLLIWSPTWAEDEAHTYVEFGARADAAQGEGATP